MSESRMQSLPKVELDTTMAELYDQERVKGNNGRLAMVLFAPCSEIAPTSRLAPNSKYLYQDPVYSMTSDDTPSEERRKIKRTMAISYLSLIPQRDAFMAGSMPLILFDHDDLEEKAARGRQGVERTIAPLKPEQKPELMFYSEPRQIDNKANNIDIFVVKAELDGLHDLPLALDLDTLYFLNTKAALCESGLPTPKSTLLELQTLNTDAESCCEACKLADTNLTIPQDCTGTRRQWLDSQISRTLRNFLSQKPPFVLKNQQTFAGGGTWIVSSPDDQSQLKKTLSKILPKLYSQVNSSNSHLKPATLIVSELIAEPTGDWGLTFFVTESGRCIFLALTQQMTSPTHSWIGSIIDYTAQESFKTRFSAIMNQIGDWLHKHGYYGPCGADILERPDGKDGGGTEFLIVDLNVRTSASHVLGLMKGHFHTRRGLRIASLIDVKVGLTREAFVAKFWDEFREGGIVVVSWFEDEDSGVSSGNVVIGARDQMAMDEFVRRIRECRPEN